MGFVVASGLAMACLIFAALSMSGHDAHNTSASATTASTEPTTAAPTTPKSTRTPKTLSAPSASGSRTPAAAPLPTLSSAASPSTTTSATTTKTSAPAVAPVAAGDCVDGSSLARTACGSSDSAYRVSSTAAPGRQCPTDSDRSAPQALPGGGTETLCMDTDWEVGRCMSMAGGAATPADCDASVPGLVRVQGIKHGTADVNTCTDANRGVVYKQRQFVVCVAQQ
ncbi:hypothetical protein [Nocardia sp. GAS34]|uniref:hypothetical protein n=1 Tax=unclassified Nocardia TaxID=2637762 RepID=UPI003D259AD5